MTGKTIVLYKQGVARGELHFRVCWREAVVSHHVFHVFRTWDEAAPAAARRGAFGWPGAALRAAGGARPSRAGRWVDTADFGGCTVVVVHRRPWSNIEWASHGIPCCKERPVHSKSK